jgi:hypothetical protein
MSQKRKHGETIDGDASVPKPFKKHRTFKPGQSHPQPKHHRRPNLSHDDENGRSVNALKSRIRDLKRLLAHVENVPKHKMSAGARQERERELEACEHELSEKLRGSREAEYRKKMIGKYHQVRFFGMLFAVTGQKTRINRRRSSKRHAHTQALEERALDHRRPTEEDKAAAAYTQRRGRCQLRHLLPAHEAVLVIVSQIEEQKK